ncbi:hypothetical protein Tco_0289838 [Tanacetum coccineum]
MLVRQAYTSTITDTESEPFKDPIETEKPQSLLIPSLPTPLLDYTPATPHLSEESEPMEASETRIASPHSTTSLSDSTSPLSPDHPLTQTSPTLTPSRAFFYRSTACMRAFLLYSAHLVVFGISARVSEGSHKLRCEELVDEVPARIGRRAASKASTQAGFIVPVGDICANEAFGSVPDQQITYETSTPRLPVRTTWVDPEDDIVYIDIEFDAPLVHAPVQTPASPEWSSGSLPVSPASLTIPTLVASPVPTTAISSGQRGDSFPAFSRLGGLETGAQWSQATITFVALWTTTHTSGALWRPVLAIEAWAGQTDAQRAALWQAKYKD